ncbi:tRNA 2-thiouridine(34) synthase MnmA [Candidatus Uhrbacteria bacterium]|nr:tRNA 2-thiouridine(34) synthase MnmA [Candidatus Uhrbacteria bacterium]
MERHKRIFVAMSGGVDSSVAAALLKEAGHDVVGGFMKNWSGSLRVPRVDGTFEFAECDWKTERRDAMRVAAQLNIPFRTYDFEREYRERVFDYMVREYDAGRTPNPDVLCNREVKFDLLWRAATEADCVLLATGHYARVEARDGVFTLKRGVDPNKDQSYFLCRLGQKELSRAMFPVGGMTKTLVREQARAFGLPVAQKKDSQGLCFVGKVDMPTFLKEKIAPKKGSIVTPGGDVIGTHEGVQFYTIGQRKGIGVADATPYFVVERRVATNELVVAHDGDPALFSRVIYASDVHWITGKVPRMPLVSGAKIRYRQEDQPCAVETTSEGVKVTFDSPQRAVAPGQFIVFYDGDELIGSAIID